MRGSGLKKTFCLLLLVFSFQLWGESSEQKYWVTESQLNELETIFKSQENLLTEQKKALKSANEQMENLNTQLKIQEELLNEYARNRKNKMIKGVVISASVGFVAGAGFIIFMNGVFK